MPIVEIDGHDENKEVSGENPEAIEKENGLPPSNKSGYGDWYKLVVIISIALLSVVIAAGLVYNHNNLAEPQRCMY